MAYKFTHTIEYDLDFDTEEEALDELANSLRRDWIYFSDEGELVKTADAPVS